ncbi:MAG: hypothetical protein Q8P05_00095 [Candidatus Diapherotrites archaeon]|nr:hypothetical protein [Candidatus Diapherotrites archaeon]MDZ4256958.1 hypothetical protein [archaeon]
MRPSFHPKKSFPFLPVAGLLLLGILFLFFFFSTTSPQPPDSNSIDESCIDISRASYPIPLSAFEYLPDIPSCLGTVAAAISSKEINDFLFFDESYYLQPEFFPSFTKEGFAYWENISPAHYGAIGFGAFPSSQKISLSPGETKMVRVFFHAGFGVRGFQGGQLFPRFQDPTSASFVQIELDPASRTGFLLGPTFPKFHPNWVHPVTIRVTATQAIPEDLVIQFHTAPPTTQNALTWSEAYAPYYFPLTQYVGSRQAFHLIVSPA